MIRTKYKKSYIGTILLVVGSMAMPGYCASPEAYPAYPARPVRMIVPLAPGGGSDIVGRIVAAALSERWNQSVIVDNRPGAGTVVGTTIAAKAPADGYTVLVSSSSIAISPALHKHLAYDVQRDFDEVTLIASQPSILAVHPSLAATSLRDMIALARSQPGRLTFASAGPGSATHLGTELLMHAAGIKLLHVPYKSAGQATTALLAGEAQILLTNMASLLPFVRSGKARALGVSSSERVALAPDIPTIAEAGLPGFEYSTWYGMLAPAGTPKTVIHRIHADTARALAAKPVTERFTNNGLLVYASPPREFTRHLDTELKKWERLIKTAGIRLE